MSTKLEDHLYPRGRSVNEPTLMPNVLDSDGNAIPFNSPKRKTTEATVVNLGDSPNSNNGDPLRTAFAKINNFIEASYWANEAINQKLGANDSELRDGIFIFGDIDSEYAIGGTDYDSDSFNTNFRYGASLSENSKVHFNGTNNQIQVSISRGGLNSHKWSQGRNWDSEIRIKFQLAETVRISTLKVSENATFDSDVNISGSLDPRGKFRLYDSDGNVVVNWDGKNFDLGNTDIDGGTY